MPARGGNLITHSLVVFGLVSCPLLSVHQGVDAFMVRPPSTASKKGGPLNILRSSCRRATASKAQRSLIWYTSGDLRLHDHEALIKDKEAIKTPVFVFDPTFLSIMSPLNIKLLWTAVQDVRASLQGIGADLVIRQGPVEEALAKIASEAQAEEIWYYHDHAESQRSLVRRGLSRLPSTPRPWRTRLRTSIGPHVGDNWERNYFPAIRGQRIDAALPAPTKLDAVWLPEDKGRCPSFEELLEMAYANEGEEMRTARIQAAREEYLTPAYTPTNIGKGGESLALAWLDEYLKEGPETFAARHLPTSGEGLERQVIRRVIQTKGLKALFDGEIFTRTFSPLLGLGCLSPRRVIQVAANGVEGTAPILRLFGKTVSPDVAMVEEVVERREWHEILAERDLEIKEPAPEPIDFRYWRWHGHLVRYAISRGDENEGNQQKPTLLLVHGFGASSDQWAKCFKELSGQFRVFALDLLGFGHSEKPAVTYTQYLWQDQVRDFAIEVVKSSFFIAGNSIGGYTAMSVAADNAALCKGVILINTAGRVVDPKTYETELAGRAGKTVEDFTRFGGLGPFSGPPKAVLTAFSVGLFWYLQPRVEKICKDLYKRAPEEVGPRLVENIVRDSCDPGALGVFASGGRLPTPRPANELLKKFGGPVLVAQGILDPLNDAKGRAALLQAAYEDVKVVEIEGGHCPHDEDPKATSAAIREFVWKVLEKGEKRMAVPAGI